MAANASFKNLTLISVPEETARIAMLKTGELDAITVGFEGMAELKALGFNTGAVSRAQPVGENFYGVYQEEGKKYPTYDIRVRKALSLAI